MTFIHKAFLHILFLTCTFALTGQNIELGEVMIEGDKSKKAPIYKGSEKRSWDLIHTDLKVSFNWQNQSVNGHADLLLEPWFLPDSLLVLDGKKFEDLAVTATVNSKPMELSFSYSNNKINIRFKNAIQRTDKVLVSIDYTAFPNKIEVTEGLAITADKGLYFINPLNDSNGFLPQIWTQGEPEANSGWFPTIDHPNERMTTRLSIELDKKLSSISNGQLESSESLDEHTKVDHWVMAQPHAPYLVMMAIGPWHFEYDQWKSIPLVYAVEPSEKGNAKRMFHKTPDILTFFSKRLGVSYPWPSLRQVVVREYVSGAMENTTGIIYGDFVYTDSLSYHDNPYEDIIAHEIFHHWFGDLVTCESWGQLPLNESFATYGEILWKQHAHGRDSADFHRYDDFMNYLYEFYLSKREKMIRFDYVAIDDMFDNHSYAKGGRILHQLRHEIGDTLFFTGLNYYLEKHKYQSVEIHQLRMAFEEVTGEDLNWFFDQWFFNEGHPVCLTTRSYSKSNITVTVQQTQSSEFYPIYRFKTEVVWKDKKGIHSKEIEVNEEYDTITFAVSAKPEWISVDPRHHAMVEWDHREDYSEILTKLESSPYPIDKIQFLSNLEPDDSFKQFRKVLEIALKDSFPGVVLEALNLTSKATPEVMDDLEAALISLAKNHKNTHVRSQALNLCRTSLKVKDANLYLSGKNALSYKVQSASLYGMYYVRVPGLLETARNKASFAKKELLPATHRVLASLGDDSDYASFMQVVKSTPSEQWGDFAVCLAEYAAYTPSDSIRENAIKTLTEWSLVSDGNYRFYAKYSLEQLVTLWKDRLENDFLSGPERKKITQLIMQQETLE